MGFFNKNYGLALLAGAMCVFGFAPFGIFAIPVLTLAALFALWLRADSAHCSMAGLCLAPGLFSAGIGWIYRDARIRWNAAIAGAAGGTAVCGILVTPARFGGIYSNTFWRNSRRSFSGGELLRITLVMPAVWALLEWFRGLLVTGFRLVLGYAHSDSPLAGYALVLGAYGVSLAAALSAGLLLLLWRARWSRQGQLALVLLLSIWGLGALLRSVAWTQPHGEPFSVALVQGNIAQNLKFNEDALVGTLETYRRLAEQNPARLTVLPETALPLLRHEVPENYVQRLRDHARQNGGDVLVGVFVRNNGSYYNSVFTLGTADEQQYHKQHLVPFGEFIPLRPLLGWLINGVLDIPMGDLARGDVLQAPLAVAGQQVAVNICYEDVFGEEIIRALPQATLLVNVTNDAWYGNSPVAAQHNQIAQLRALETGRMMLRATNTGVTSIIGANGRVLQQLPQHQEAVLKGMAQGYEGITPYVRWGNAAVMLLIALMLAYAWARRYTSPDKGRPGGVKG